jgi:ethanolamine-phosphate cytidylyltransferase
LTPGVIRLLKRASELGDFVLVGLYSDDDIKEKVGNSNYPFLNVLERTLNLLSLKYV